MPTITLLVLVLNEIDGLKAIMPQVPRDLFKKIIVVDGGSDDGSIEWCIENNYELFSQTRAGIRYAYWDVWERIESDYVLTISPDGNCDMNKIELLIEEAKNGFDLIIGSRYLGGNTSFDDDFITRFGNRFYNKYAQMFFGSTLTDVMVIYRCFRTDLPKKLDLFNEKHYKYVERMLFTSISWEPLMTVRAIKQGFKTIDVLAGEPRRIGGVRKLQIFRWGAAYLIQFIKETIVKK
jgi:glycosyltransferase involved in cell wall biosynthesis